ncbi:MAG TPA: M23 family metallopeptidase [Oscillatoriaceae cyanobacterium M7585_C2015_266]|nr:M23 family metallopeptidase [Oscillatoriaceae cyanobacterium M7585_C2015_266]
MSPTHLEPITVGAFSVSDSSIGLNTQQNPPASALPLPSGFYYQNTLPRANSQPGNGNTQLLFPLTIPAVITSAFGWRIHPIIGENSFHSGTDLAAPMGTPVLAAYDGKVKTADYLGGYGLTVILEHDNGTRETLYAHLSDIFVKPGDKVPQGSVIGTVGSTGNSTGPHLHFELRELTASGWVIVDPGAQLQHALAQLVKALQTAQSNPKPKAG